MSKSLWGTNFIIITKRMWEMFRLLYILWPNFKINLQPGLEGYKVIIL